MYFDKQGKPISSREWAELFHDREYQILKHDTVNGILISTVWLGLNHRHFGIGDPLIFETMVFAEDEGVRVDVMGGRWTNEQEAMAQHRRLVIYYTNKKAASKD